MGAVFYFYYISHLKKLLFGFFQNPDHALIRIYLN